MWHNISFSKTPSFRHEEEFRLLLVNPNRVGGLSDEQTKYEIKDNQDIVDAIYASDIY